MKTTTLSRAGNFSGGVTGLVEATRMLAQSFIKLNITGPATDLTDGSTGAADGSIHGIAPFVDTAASGNNLASKAATEAALGTVKNALATLFAQASGLIGSVGGLPNCAYNGGGTVGSPADNTTNPVTPANPHAVGSVTKNVAGAGTGPSSANLEPIRSAIDVAFYNLGVLTNRLAEATGDTPVNLPVKTSFLGTGVDNQRAASGSAPYPSAVVLAAIAAIPTDTGAAGATGVTASDFSAALAAWANSTASIAAVLNAITSPGTARVVPVR